MAISSGITYFLWGLFAAFFLFFMIKEKREISKLEKENREIEKRNEEKNKLKEKIESGNAHADFNNSLDVLHDLANKK